MPNRRRPRQGSMAYSPRKRASRQTPKLDAWPEISEGPKIQGFAGYKAGMTHAFIVDYNKTSTTAGQEIRIPVTVLEVPPMKIAAIRVYENTRYGLKTAGEVWASGVDESTIQARADTKEVRCRQGLGEAEGSGCRGYPCSGLHPAEDGEGSAEEGPGAHGAQDRRRDDGQEDGVRQDHPRQGHQRHRFRQGRQLHRCRSDHQGERVSREPPRGGGSSCCPTRTASTGGWSVPSVRRGPGMSGTPPRNPVKWDITRGPRSTSWS
jgi:ribosomal protein L3